MSSQTELSNMLVSELKTMAKSLGITDYDALRKQDLIARIMQVKADAAPAAPAGKSKPEFEELVSGPDPDEDIVHDDDDSDDVGGDDEDDDDSDDEAAEAPVENFTETGKAPEVIAPAVAA